MREPTSYALWTSLAQTYAKPSRAHILQVKDRLNSISKTSNQSVTDYTHSIKACTDKLASLGKPVDPEDITAHVIRGLDYSLYKPLIDVVNAGDDPISFDNLHEKLMNFELTIKHQAVPAPFPATANAAYRANNRPYTQQYTKPTPNLNQASSSTNPNPAPFKGKCQYCRAVGHVISNCYKFKRDYPNVVFPSSPAFVTRTNRPSPQAHTATTHPNPNPANPSRPWLLHSGATHHITSDLDNLALHSPYDGGDDLLIGDGSALPITHTGSFTTATWFHEQLPPPPRPLTINPHLILLLLIPLTPLPHQHLLPRLPLLHPATTLPH